VKLTQIMGPFCVRLSVQEAFCEGQPSTLPASVSPDGEAEFARVAVTIENWPFIRRNPDKARPVWGAWDTAHPTYMVPNMGRNFGRWTRPSGAGSEGSWIHLFSSVTSQVLSLFCLAYRKAIKGQAEAASLNARCDALALPRR